ncbi:MAG: decarboxylase [Rhodobacterales bacterium 32-67-9]|nr:MAG: decarboxylase [Rhodobacterales bacterium 32-67-9]
MTLLADLLSTVFERRTRSLPSTDRDERTLEQLCAALVGSTGEVSGVTIASLILVRYEALDDGGKLGFFRHVAGALNIDPEQARAALAAYATEATRKSYADFMSAVEPARQELMRRLNQAPGATERLVAMRADLLRLSSREPALQALDLDFRHLFSSWFNRGFLVLRPINWGSPAHILEKIIAYEAVHTIDSWDDLRRRLKPTDRRCFAFFHPAMPDEPLIFVEVALTVGIPGSIQQLLAEDRTPLASEKADTAVFYSISNCQPGLAGISFGNSLIKQVAADLAKELQGLKTFVTLSPIPGLAAWMESENLTVAVEDHDRVRQIAARYLLTAKRDDGLPLDPVERFHLGNGAIVHEVHAGADTSPKGRAQSAGAMVNYLYDLSKVTQNHEKFATGHVIATSREMRALAKPATVPIKK